jgi:hypothetical protein
LMKEANRMDLKSSKIWKISGQFYKEIWDLKGFLQSYPIAYEHEQNDPLFISELCNLYLQIRNFTDFWICL